MAHAEPDFDDIAQRAREQLKREAPRPLPSELLSVEKFPTEALPEAFRPWVEDVAERMQCPSDFIAVPLLVAASSLAARLVAVRPRQRDDWQATGNLWAMIVGRPGVMKSPAMKAALVPIERLEAAAAEAHNAELTQWKLDRARAEALRDVAKAQARAALKKDRGADISTILAVDDEGTGPVRMRYLVHSPTWQALHELLAANAGGVMMVRDELRGWFLDMAREENGEARSFFVQAWSGGTFTVDRIGRGTITARDLRLSIIGAIQPGPLEAVMRAARHGGGDDGLIDRFLVSWPDDPGPWRDVDRWPDSAARQRVRLAFDQLDALSPWSVQAEQAKDADGEPAGMPFLRLDDAAREAFGEWRADLERRLRESGDEGLEGALAKFRHHVPAMALTLHLSDGGVGPVTAAAMLGALDLADYFESHARRLHSSGRRSAVRGARSILAKVRSGEIEQPFTARQVHQRGWSGLTDREVVGEALDMLVSHGWLAESLVDNTGGRPTVVFRMAEGARHG